VEREREANMHGGRSWGFRAGFFLGCATFLGWACPVALTRADNPPGEEASLKLDAEVIAARTAETFYEAWGRRDMKQLQRLLDFPFSLFFPCKNHPPETWGEWEARLLDLGPLGGRYRSDRVITVGAYVTSLGGTAKEVEGVEKELGANVHVVGIRDAAVFVRVGLKENRVVGFGFFPPARKR
jgi:hypothetical protein